MKSKNRVKSSLCGGFGFVEILIVLAIVLFLCYKLFNLYFKKSPINKETTDILSTQGIDTSNYKAIIDSAKDKVQAIQEQQSRELEAIK